MERSTPVVEPGVLGSLLAPPFEHPLRLCAICDGFEIPVNTMAMLAPHRPIQKDEEMSHHLVIAVLFGEFEESFDQRFVPIRIERQFEIFQQKATRLRATILI